MDPTTTLMLTQDYLREKLRILRKLYGKIIHDIVKEALRTREIEANWEQSRMLSLETMGQYHGVSKRQHNFKDFLLFAGLDLTQLIVRQRQHVDTTEALRAYELLYKPSAFHMENVDIIVHDDLNSLYGPSVAYTVVKWWRVLRATTPDDYFKGLRMTLNLGYGTHENVSIHLDDHQWEESRSRLNYPLP